MSTHTQTRHDRSDDALSRVIWTSIGLGVVLTIITLVLAFTSTQATHDTFHIPSAWNAAHIIINSEAAVLVLIIIPYYVWSTIVREQRYMAMMSGVAAIIAGCTIIGGGVWAHTVVEMDMIDWADQQYGVTLSFSDADDLIDGQPVDTRARLVRLEDSQSNEGRVLVRITQTELTRAHHAST